MLPLPSPFLNEAVALLNGYQPTVATIAPDDWERVRPVVLASMGMVRWPSRDSARSLVRFVIGLLLFTERSGHGLDPWVAFRPATLERYVEVELADVARSTRSSVRAHLRVVARAVQPQLWPEFHHYSKPTDQPGPYTERELAGLLAAAEALDSPLFRRRALSLMLLGVGAGLAVLDLRDLTGGDIVRADDGALEVHVPEPRARVVPVLDRWAPRLEQVAAELGDDLVVGRSTEKSRRNLTTNICRKMLATGAPVRLTMTRLRTTWLCTQLAAGTPLDVLLDAAGVTSVAVVQHALQFVPGADPDVARAVLRGAAS